MTEHETITTERINLESETGNGITGLSCVKINKFPSSEMLFPL
jgi:hypothetical protein